MSDRIEFLVKQCAENIAFCFDEWDAEARQLAQQHQDGDVGEDRLKELISVVLADLSGKIYDIGYTDGYAHATADAHNHLQSIVASNRSTDYENGALSVVEHLEAGPFRSDE